MLWFGEAFCKDRINAFQYQYPSTASLLAAMKEFNSRTRAVSVAEKVPLVDLESEIEKDFLHFKDDVHYTTKGARRVAEQVAGKINAESLLPPVPRSRS